MTEQAAWPARQHSGHPATVTRDVPMTHRIHATVQAMEPANLRAMMNGIFAKTDGNELTVRNNTMLPTG
jgi:hypothetical protein